ncbi:MAG: hypothetical protein ABSA11_13850 [Candidatus Bathyarchaeia archaeon]|jgi:hypothetical protein
MVDLVTLQATAYVAQVVGVIGTLTAAFIGVRSYINSNRRTQETRDRELDTRQAQLFTQIYEEFRDPDFVERYFEIMSREWKDPEDYYRKYPFPKKNILSVENYFEGIAVLLKRGWIDADLIYDIFPTNVTAFWQKYESIVKDWRVRADMPNYFSLIEFLSNELNRVAVGRGDSVRFGGYDLVSSSSNQVTSQ